MIGRPRGLAEEVPFDCRARPKLELSVDVVLRPQRLEPERVSGQVNGRPAVDFWEVELLAKPAQRISRVEAAGEGVAGLKPHGGRANARRSSREASPGRPA